MILGNLKIIFIPYLRMILCEIILHIHFFILYSEKAWNIIKRISSLLIANLQMTTLNLEKRVLVWSLDGKPCSSKAKQMLCRALINI